MRITLMCPKCGDIRFPYTASDSDYICDDCGTKRIDVGQAVEDSEINYDSDRDLLEQRIYRKHLFNNPLFDEVIFEERLRKRKAFKESVHEYVAKLPKCPTCQSTDIAPISGLERGASVLTLGLFSKKINKSFKCNKCGYTW